MQTAGRLSKVPPYLFAELDRKKREAQKQGVNVINLGIGDPDLPTPTAVVERLQSAARDPRTHRYPDYKLGDDFRSAAAGWLHERFGVQVDPDTELIGLIGSKEGIAHTCWAFVEEGTYALVPDPGYPVYATQAILAGGKPYALPLVEENAFLPDLETIPRAVLDSTRIMFINYPNNPTAAVASLEFFERAVALARRHEFLLCHDAAYVELTFDGYQAPSLLQVPGAAEVCLEFHSLSKTFNMTGWRIGFAAGDRRAVRALGSIKTNTDSGQFGAIQSAGVEALRSVPESFVSSLRSTYIRRRDTVVDGLLDMGINARRPQGTFYVWARVPGEESSTEFAERLITDAGVVVSPGRAFGEHGEGYFRISLTASEEDLREGLNRIGKMV